MKALKIGDLTAKVPIVQGGMGVGISLSGLASAVANAGGVGVISAAGLGVIYRELASTFNEASIIGLSLIAHTAVKTVERKQPSRHMLLLSKQYTGAPFEETVCLQKPDGSRSDWYQQQTQDFYL